MPRGLKGGPARYFRMGRLGQEVQGDASADQFAQRQAHVTIPLVGLDDRAFQRSARAVLCSELCVWALEMPMIITLTPPSALCDEWLNEIARG
jgi:hypothetical protein